MSQVDLSTLQSAATVDARGSAYPGLLIGQRRSSATKTPFGRLAMQARRSVSL